MPKYRNVSGEEVVKILCNKFGFKITGRKGSHVRLSKETPNGKVGTVVPMHKSLKIGTLKGILKLAKIDFDEFAKYL
ncbi:YcfA family protein [Methanocaldococcus sp. FS406-22]|uniref:type II toxin-antitoxin system HicA family toxin n=1 Tax=Methanocaldococcus sp. (strain FS406-22) TaxID=644281 RepID=UPI0001BF4FE1|nr:type II toxin-antitoxin system HicA family toxin [Methanocaldococcus sp. FS406-22]ADC69593.1 YcfA family protein [Methanocaldococcus sp. FS406-22]